MGFARADSGIIARGRGPPGGAGVLDPARCPGTDLDPAEVLEAPLHEPLAVEVLVQFERVAEGTSHASGGDRIERPVDNEGVEGVGDVVVVLASHAFILSEVWGEFKPPPEDSGRFSGPEVGHHAGALAVLGRPDRLRRAVYLEPVVVADFRQGHGIVPADAGEDDLLGFRLAGRGDNVEVPVRPSPVVALDGEEGESVGGGLGDLDRVVHHDLVLGEKVGTVIGVVVHGSIIADEVGGSSGRGRNLERFYSIAQRQTASTSRSTSRSRITATMTEAVPPISSARPEKMSPVGFATRGNTAWGIMARKRIKKRCPMRSKVSIHEV